MVYALLVLFAAIVAAAFWIGGWGGGIVALIVLGAALIYIAVARRKDPTVGTIERGRRREPSGRVRSGHSGAETANERTGQE